MPRARPPLRRGRRSLLQVDAPAEKAAPTRRYEFGSTDDYQLQQAMNALKGKPVETAKPKAENVAKAPR